MKYYLGIFVFVLSCTTGEKPELKDDNLNEKDSIDFNVFIDKINNECAFQKERIEFPLLSISLIDLEIESYDTTYISEKDYECMQFTSPNSNMINEKVKLKQVTLSAQEKIILLGVEDTGLHIQYFFKLKNDKWFLVKILDQST